MQFALVVSLLVFAFVPLIANADPLDADATSIISGIRGDVQSYQKAKYNSWAAVSYKKKTEFGKTIYVFKVRTNEGFLKIKVTKKRNGVTLASVKAIGKDDPLDFS